MEVSAVTRKQTAGGPISVNRTTSQPRCGTEAHREDRGERGQARRDHRAVGAAVGDQPAERAAEDEAEAEGAEQQAEALRHLCSAASIRPTCAWAAVRIFSLRALASK
jgi:hypothetical protein